MYSVCVCVYVRVRVCMCVCMCVCAHVCMFVCDTRSSKGQLACVLLQKMVGASSVKELGHHDTMLLLSDTPDAWRMAGPAAMVIDEPYPFDKSRPTAKEVRCLSEAVYALVHVHIIIC